MALGETGAVMMLVWLPPFLPGLPRPGPIKMGGPLSWGYSSSTPAGSESLFFFFVFFFGSESFEESSGVV